MTYVIDLRTLDSGGGVAAEPQIWQGDFIDYANAPTRYLNKVEPVALADLISGRDLLFATHGFNVNRPDGISALSRWETLLTLPNVFYVAVVWPGDSSWAHGLDYPAEGNEAISSGRLLADFINQYFLSAASISFASHSLGARMILEAAQGIDRKKLGRAILMAGAIDDDCLSVEYAAAAQKFDRISILSSKCDDVLKWAFPLGNLFGGIVTKGSPYWHGALGRFGPNLPVPPSVVFDWQIPDNWGYGHHNYLPSAGPGPVPAALPTPVYLPPRTKPQPGPALTASWSAAFVSTRLQPP